MGRSTTIVDVAQAAGVSKSTVSNVVRGAEPVSDETRRRVQAAIERLNYTPNGIARQFVKRRTTMVGVLVGDLGNHYHAHLAQAVERALFHRGHTAMFCNVDGDEDLAVAGVEALLEQRVAGFVLMGQVERAAQVAASLRASEAPVVTIGLRQGWSDSVGPRDREGGRLAASHLLDRGHRRIAYVRTSSAEAGADRARHAGYASALRAAGIDPLPPILWDPGSVAIATALQPPGAPTAAVVWNDHTAVALIDACEAAGIHVPATLSVVGFDDIDVARLGRISLTTVAQPLDLQAEKAVAMLLDRIDAGPAGRPRHVSVPVELRIRRSTAPARRSARR
ncbi:MAG TPA: LacI family DNA-binding transcriptional regulator [Gaiellales bacterium]|nr:LacI family DNA-binding transcriptional regulator [Gaiellales bacterium]